MADMWTKGLRGGEPMATPRTSRAQKPGVQGPGPGGKPEKLAQSPALVAATPLRAQPQTSFTARKTPGLTVDTLEALKPDSPSKPASVYSGDGDDTEMDFENDSVRVFVRVRPPTKQETSHEKHEQCITVLGTKTLQLQIKDKQRETLTFKFDQVMPEDTTQQGMFDLAGLVAVDNCLAGYNSSIFAYGQTGSGKTFTVIGDLQDAETRGLAPRVFDYLFQKITDQENARGPDTVKYNCRCAFLEIYNETIADLLCPSANNLPIREDPEKGPYVDHLSEPIALNGDEMLGHLVRGAENRHTGETRLNEKSSRSHSVFMVTVEKTVTSNGISKCFYARLNLVDLAGSERIASGAHGGSNATGEHFKEACHINKSLTALGRVTTELLKSQKNNGTGHVPYRDSKLTFLLQSSLGGNAKTLIIANVSPSSVCSHETLSTLRFARQTKHIRNDAKVNWTVQGDRIAMQREIERLRMELASMRSGLTEPLVAANEELTAKLDAERHWRETLEQERDRILNELKQTRRENKVLDQRLVTINGQCDGGRAGALATAVEQVEAAEANSWRISALTAQAERDWFQEQLAAEAARRAALLQQLGEAECGRAEANNKCADLAAQLDGVLREKAEVEEGLEVLAGNFAQAGEKLAEQKEQLAAADANLQRANSTIQGLEQQLAEERAAKDAASEEVTRLQGELEAAKAETHAAVAHGASLQEQLAERDLQLGQQTSRADDLQQQLEKALADAKELQHQLAQAQDRLTLQERDSSASHTALSDRVAELTAQLSSTDSRAAASEAAGVQLEQELQAAQQQVTERDTQLAQLQEQLSAKSAEWSEVLQRLAATEADLTEQAAGRAAAEAEVASLTQRLEATDSSLAATQESSLHQAEALAKAQQELADLQQQLEARGSELADVSSQAEELRDELQQLRVRERELEGSTQHHQAEGVRLGELVANLEAQLGAARGDHGASEQRVRQLTEELSAAKAKCEELEEAKAQLEATTARQVSNKQELDRTVSTLEARVAELEFTRAALAEQLESESETVKSLSEVKQRQEACIAELRQRVEQEEDRRLGMLREMSETTASSQRQIAELEEQHLVEVQQLKDELDRRNADLKARDHEVVRTNFALKGEIDRLQSALEQSRREAAASKAAQEQLVSAHNSTLAEMNQRLNSQKDRYNELTKKHDVLKQQLDTTQREAEVWKTKCDRLDTTMTDVTRLIRFARNPPDSARSSLMLTRSDQMPPQPDSSRRASAVSGSRGLTMGALNAAGSLSLRVTESPAASPRMTRFSVASPAASKAGSMSVTASQRLMDGCDDDWEATSRAMPDVCSPGDQLPVPALDQDV